MSGFFGWMTILPIWKDLLEAHVLPGLAAVGGLVDAVAVGDGVARIVLAGADPDDVAFGRGDGDVADGDGGFVVELVLEGEPLLVVLSKPARRGGDLVASRVGLEDGEGRDAAAHVGRADRAPGEQLVEIFGDRRRVAGRLHLGGCSLERFELTLQLLQALLKVLDFLGDLRIDGVLGLPGKGAESEEREGRKRLQQS